jgi:hypothetical protein
MQLFTPAVSLGFFCAFAVPELHTNCRLNQRLISAVLRYTFKVFPAREPNRRRRIKVKKQSNNSNYREVKVIHE